VPARRGASFPGTALACEAGDDSPQVLTMKHPIPRAFAACALSAAMAGAAFGAGGNALSGSDKQFAEKAAIGGLAEVQMGNLAQQKAASDQVRQFGMRMVQDHTKANDELKQVASNKGIQLPTALDSKHQKKMEKLSKMTGAEFDKAYMDDMVSDHKEDVSEFKKEANGGKDADLKAFAAKTLPTLQEHLQMAQSTHDAVKKGSKTASR